MTHIARRSVVVFLVAAMSAFGLPPLLGGVLSTREARAQQANTPATPEDGRTALTDLWSESARTYALPDGTNQTEVFAGQVNFKTAGSADWQPIDNTLVVDEDGDGWQNSANDYSVELPTDLAAGPVDVQEGQSWVKYELEGAAATGATDTAVVTYEEALPGVDVKVEAANEIVKEDLVLSGPESPSTFVYDISYSSDVSPRVNEAGGIDFVRADGDVPFYFAAPYMTDAAGAYSSAVTMELLPGGQLKVTADAGWLADPTRVWPVKVDPSVVVDQPYDDGWINSAVPNSVNNGANLKVGPASDGSQARALLRFGSLLTSGIPADAVVTGSALEMHVTGTTTTTPIDLVVRRLTKSWSPSSTTWNNPWTNAGGDMDVDLFVDQKTMGGSTGPVVFHPGRLVQKWIERDEPNHGLMIRTHSSDEDENNRITFASTEATDSSKWPKLTVDWSERLGDRPFYTYENFTINDRQELKVNVANGNALLKATDMNIASGVGSDITVERYFNSHYNFHSHSGHNWRIGTGHDVELSEYGPDVVMKYPGHHHYMFWHKKDGGWRTPPGLRGDLTETTAGYEFRFRDTDETWRFAGPDLPRTEIEDRNGNVLSFSYLTDGRLDKITNNEGQNVSFWYNGPNGELTKVQDWTGRYAQYTYSSYGGDGRRLLSFRDASGNLVYYDYNTDGDITCITTGEGRQTKITYDSASPARVSDVQKLDSLYTGTGDRCASTSGPKWSFEYLGFSGSPSRGSTKVTEPRHQNLTTPKFTKYTYDTEDRVEETKDALDFITKSEWTTDSNVQSYTDAAGTSSGNPQRLYSFSYNTAGDVTGVKMPSGAQSAVTYDSSGSQQQLPRSYEDEQGNRWDYEYYVVDGNDGKKNNLKSVCVVPDPAASSKKCDETPDGQKDLVTYTYFGNGNLEKIIDDAGNETVHAYFPDGNLEYVDHPAPLPNRSFTYDALNRQATVVDGKGQAIAYTYDALDRVDVVTYKNASGVTVGTVDYTYDADGNITSRVDGNQEVVYDFDALNQQTKRTDKVGSTVQWETAYSYDLVGNLRFLTQNPGTVNENQVEYKYNPVSDVDKMFLPGKSNPIDFNYSHRLATKTVFPNGAQITYGRTSDGKIASVKAGPSATNDSHWVSRSYSYTDPQSVKRSLLQKMTDTWSTGEVVDYKYDGASRLDKALSNNGNDFDYDYDANGNLTHERVNGSLATQLTYHPSNEINERIAGGTTYTFSHDGNGNLTRERDPAQNDVLTLNYNVRDQMSQAGDSNTPLFSMAYNGPGQFERTQKDSTSFASDLMGVGSEQTGSGTRTYYHRDPSGKIVAMQRGSNFYYYIGDYMGSVLRVINDVQNPVGVARYSYEPYGGTVVHNDSIGNPWRWAGGYHDTSVGLYKFGTRYYRPQIFRFTQQDPKAPNLYKPIKLNRWAYASDDPVNRIDPSGQFDWEAVERDAARTGLAGAAGGCAVGLATSGPGGCGAGAFLGFVGGYVTGFVDGVLTELDLEFF